MKLKSAALQLKRASPVASEVKTNFNVTCKFSAILRFLRFIAMLLLARTPFRRSSLCYDSRGRVRQALGWQVTPAAQTSGLAEIDM